MTGNDANDCKSALASCKTITGAIIKSLDSDTIVISEGTYVENLTFGNKSLTFQGAGAEKTIIDGGGIEKVFSLWGDTTSSVGFKDLTVQNGEATMGAGILVNGNISLNVEGCRIINNQATSGVGGGVICFGAGIHSFSNSEISNNSATAYGGGVHLNEGEITFTNVTFSHNTAGSGGSSFTMDSSGTAHFVVLQD